MSGTIRLLWWLLFLWRVVVIVLLSPVFAFAGMVDHIYDEVGWAWRFR